MIYDPLRHKPEDLKEVTKSDVVRFTEVAWVIEEEKDAD